jgi:transcriptional regulator with GAF, ATPase, and Fis domain
MGRNDSTLVQDTREPGSASHTLRAVAMWSGGHVVRDLPAAGSIVLGRSDEADLVLDHPSVSRRHATITIGEQLTIEDHGSANGTWVGGVKLEPGSVMRIAPGIAVEIGSVMVVVRGAVAGKREVAAKAKDDAVIADPAMYEVNELVEVVANSKLTVLLHGETGVGKEVIAARIHMLSPRKDKPFLKLNCAALVENLLESELFGHEKGAFTGAVASKPGLAEAADGGTLFLDEVGELSLATQAKLLRLLESGEVTRVGALKATPVDVRFVCATNRGLPEMVERGTFRQDLYFRLDGLTIHVPPLRQRPGEIEPLARRFLAEAAANAGRTAPAISEEALDVLARHDWPGNVRELRNVIARSLLFCKGAILQAADVRIERTRSENPAPPPADDKQKRVLDALEKSLWNQTRAAALLGISRRTLHNWLDELGIPRARGGKP